MAPIYTKEQVNLFLEYIGLPKSLRDVPPSLFLLKQLHIYSISTLPYENLSLHYNPSHSIDLDFQHLFNKIVTSRNGRGGFCMELALLYWQILVALGFNVYPVGVRTRPRVSGVPIGDYPGWGHIVIIASFPDGSRYFDDMAFGGDGPTLPLPLQDGYVHQNLGTQQVRVCREWIPGQTHRTESSKQWIYQYRNQVDQPWISFYAFPEMEFMGPDWGVLNHWMNTHPDSNHVKNVLVVKFLRSEDDTQAKITGKLMLVNNLVKRNLGGKTMTVQELTTEEERIEALDKWFGIKFSQEETMAIEASPLMLR